MQTLRGCKERASLRLEAVPLALRTADGGAVHPVVQGVPVPSATRPLDIVSFLLTPQETRRRIPATSRFNSGPGAGGKIACRSRGGETCSICRVGPCNVLIRNAWLAATGCVPPLPEANFAATVMRRSTMFRRRWALACGCVLAHWVATVRRVVPPGVHGSRRSRADWARSSRPIRDEPSPQESLSKFLCNESQWSCVCGLPLIGKVLRMSRRPW